jgi:hypothetical protein
MYNCAAFMGDEQGKLTDCIPVFVDSYTLVEGGVKITGGSLARGGLVCLAAGPLWEVRLNRGRSVGVGVCSAILLSSIFNTG